MGVQAWMERRYDLVVLGGGPTGCELGQAFARLGSGVEIVEAAPALLPGEDPETGRLIADTLAREGVGLELGAAVTGEPRDGAAARLNPTSPREGPSSVWDSYATCATDASTAGPSAACPTASTASWRRAGSAGSRRMPGYVRTAADSGDR
jgi:choline dehydrogenase-like flavoprotein